MRIEKHLEWCDWSRHSTRQKARMQMGGLTGEIMVCLDGCEEASALWPFLRLGALVHAGKGATMGLGRYDLAAASLPSAA
ncbi:MAG: CRISPR system precrRNA processing endoribonuclease RAMP protein Cas6 [Gammaproteobacteria bacterium]|nr:CRISPR system precrRNA processing endoribonuclease RAMP protein Cas6 [Gammaproteobacteria bacterium]NIU02811.1 CRISPR system precrRNA processing endoribonuclease RAMP protein Cas6 [Gammaproteobacteria bacterium]NIX84086.1 CRISPR system precrRNA processing endoribonuclease RAMP protein Cas6 [Gammaproteobacteria bacterium]